MIGRTLSNQSESFGTAPAKTIATENVTLATISCDCDVSEGVSWERSVSQTVGLPFSPRFKVTPHHTGNQGRASFLTVVDGPVLESVELVEPPVHRDVADEVEHVVVFTSQLLVEFKHLLPARQEFVRKPFVFQ